MYIFFVRYATKSHRILLKKEENVRKKNNGWTRTKNHVKKQKQEQTKQNETKINIKLKEIKRI